MAAAVVARSGSGTSPNDNQLSKKQLKEISNCVSDANKGPGGLGARRSGTVMIRQLDSQRRLRVQHFQALQTPTLVVQSRQYLPIFYGTAVNYEQSIFSRL